MSNQLQIYETSDRSIFNQIIEPSKDGSIMRFQDKYFAKDRHWPQTQNVEVNLKIPQKSFGDIDTVENFVTKSITHLNPSKFVSTKELSVEARIMFVDYRVTATKGDDIDISSLQCLPRLENHFCISCKEQLKVLELSSSVYTAGFDNLYCARQDLNLKNSPLSDEEVRDVALTLDFLRKSFSDKNYLEIKKNANTIISLCRRNKAAQSLFGSNGICRLIADMLNESAELTLVVLDLISSLIRQDPSQRSSTNIKNVNLLATAQAFNKYVNIFKYNMENAVICESICRVVAFSAFGKKQWSQLLALNIVDSLVSCFLTHINNVNVVEACCIALMYLSADEVGAAMLVKKNVVGYFVDILRNSDHPQSVAAVCGTIGSIASHNDSANYLATSFICTPLINELRKWYNISESVVENILYALCHLSRHEVLNGQLGAIDSNVLLLTFQRYMSNKSIIIFGMSLSSSCDKLKKEMCPLLLGAVMSFNDPYLDDLFCVIIIRLLQLNPMIMLTYGAGEYGICARITKIVTQTIPSSSEKAKIVEEHISHACNAVSAICQLRSEYALELSSLGLCAALADINNLRRGSDMSAIVLRAISDMCGNTSTNDKIIEVFIRLNLVDSLLQTINEAMYLSEENISSNAHISLSCIVLSKLVCVKNARDQISKTNCFKLLVSFGKFTQIVSTHKKRVSNSKVDVSICMDDAVTSLLSIIVQLYASIEIGNFSLSSSRFQDCDVSLSRVDWTSIMEAIVYILGETEIGSLSHAFGYFTLATLSTSKNSEDCLSVMSTQHLSQIFETAYLTLSWQINSNLSYENKFSSSTISNVVVVLNSLLSNASTCKMALVEVTADRCSVLTKCLQHFVENSSLCELFVLMLKSIFKRQAQNVMSKEINRICLLLVDVLRFHCHDESAFIVVAACNFIDDLCYGDQSNALVFFENDIFNVLVECLRRSNQTCNLKITVAVVNTFINLSFGSFDYQHESRLLGLCNVVLDSLQARYLGDNEGVNAKLLWLLGILCVRFRTDGSVDINIDNINTLVDSGAINIAQSLLERYCNNVIIPTSIALIFFSIVEKCRKHKDVWDPLTYENSLVITLKNIISQKSGYSEDERTTQELQYAIFSLLNLLIPENDSVIFDSRLVGSIFDGIAKLANSEYFNHLSCKIIAIFSVSVNLQENFQHYQNSLLETNSMQKIVNLILASKHDYRFLGNAISILHCLLRNNTAGVTILMDLKDVTEAIGVCITSEFPLLVELCELLTDLLSNSELFLSKFISLGYAVKVLSLLTVNSEDGRIEESICVVVKLLINSSKDFEKAAIDNEIFSLLFSVLKRHVDNEQINASVTALISILSNVSENKTSNITHSIAGVINPCDIMISNVCSSYEKFNENELIVSLISLATLGDELAHQLYIFESSHNITNILISLLKSTSSSPSVISHTLQTIYSLCKKANNCTSYNNSNIDKFSKLNIVLPVLFAVSSNITNSKIVEYGLQVLYLIVGYNQNQLKTFSNSNLFKIIYESSDRYFESDIIVKYSCQLLSLLLENPGNKSVIADSSVCPPLGKVLLHHVKNLSVVVSVLRSVVKVVTTQQVEVIESFLRQDLVKTLISIMNDYKSKGEINVLCCEILSVLMTYFEVECRQNIFTCGGYDVLFAVLPQSSDVRVIYQCLRLFLLLLINCSPEDIPRRKAVGVVVNSTRSVLNDDQCCVVACQVMVLLTTDNRENQKYLGQEKGLELFMSMLEVHWLNENVVVACLPIFRLMCDKYEDQFKLIVDLGFCNSMPVLLVKHMMSKAVVEEICACVCNVMRDPSEYFRKTNLISDIMDLIIFIITSDHFCDNSLAFIIFDIINLILVCSPDLIQVFSDNKICELLHQKLIYWIQLRNFYGLEIVCQTVSNLCMLHSCADTFNALGVVTILYDMHYDIRAREQTFLISWCNAFSSILNSIKCVIFSNESLVNILISLLSLYAENQVVLTSIYHLTASLACYNKQCQIYFGNVGMCKSLMKVLRSDTPKLPAFQIALLKVASTLAYHNLENQNVFQEENIIEYTVDLIGFEINNVDNAALLRAYLELIASICCENSSSQQLYARTGICKKLLDMLQHSSSEDIIMATMKVIISLIENQENIFSQHFEGSLVDILCNYYITKIPESIDILLEVLTLVEVLFKVSFKSHMILNEFRICQISCGLLSEHMNKSSSKDFSELMCFSLCSLIATHSEICASNSELYRCDQTDFLTVYNCCKQFQNGCEVFAASIMALHYILALDHSLYKNLNKVEILTIIMDGLHRTLLDKKISLILLKYLVSLCRLSIEVEDDYFVIRFLLDDSCTIHADILDLYDKHSHDILLMGEVCNLVACVYGSEVKTLTIENLPLIKLVYFEFSILSSNDAAFYDYLNSFQRLLSYSPIEVVEEFGTRGTCELVVSKLNESVSNPQKSLLLCNCLNRLCTVSIANSERVISSMNCNVFNDLLVNSQKYEDAVRSLCTVILTLCSNSSDACESFCYSNTLAPLISALKLYQDSKPHILLITGCMYKMSIIPSSIKGICNVDVKSLFYSIIQRCKYTDDLQLLLNVFGLYSIVCGSLGVIDDNAAVHYAELLNTFHDEATISFVCSTIHHLCCSVDTFALTLVMKSDICNILITALQEHHEVNSKSKICLAIGSISHRCPQALENFSKFKNITSTVINILKSSFSSKDICQDMVFVLYSLSHSEDINVEFLTNIKFCSFAIDLISKFSDTLHICVYIYKTMSRILTKSENYSIDFAIISFVRNKVVTECLRVLLLPESSAEITEDILALLSLLYSDERNASDSTLVRNDFDELWSCIIYAIRMNIENPVINAHGWLIIRRILLLAFDQKKIEASDMLLMVESLKTFAQKKDIIEIILITFKQVVESDSNMLTFATFYRKKIESPMLYCSLLDNIFEVPSLVHLCIHMISTVLRALEGTSLDEDFLNKMIEISLSVLRKYSDSVELSCSIMDLIEKYIKSTIDKEVIAFPEICQEVTQCLSQHIENQPLAGIIYCTIRSILLLNPSNYEYFGSQYCCELFAKGFKSYCRNRIANGDVAMSELLHCLSILTVSPDITQILDLAHDLAYLLSEVKPHYSFIGYLLSCIHNICYYGKNGIVGFNDTNLCESLIGILRLRVHYSIHIQDILQLFLNCLSSKYNDFLLRFIELKGSQEFFRILSDDTTKYIPGQISCVENALAICLQHDKTITVLKTDIRVINELLESSKRDADIVMSSCRLYEALVQATDPKNIISVLEDGTNSIIILLQDLCKEYINSDDVTLALCRCLGVIFEHSEQASIHLQKNGFMKFLLILYDLYIEHEAIVVEIIKCLYFTQKTCTSSRIAAADVVDKSCCCTLIAGAISKFKSSKKLLHYIPKLITELSKSYPEVIIELGKNGLCEILLRVMHDFIHEENQIGDKDMFDEIAEMFQILSTASENRILCVQNKVLEHLVEINMKEKKTQNDVMLYALVIQNLTLQEYPDRHDYQILITKSGLCNAILPLIENYISHPIIVYDLTQSLISCCYGSDINISDINENKGPEIFAMVLKEFNQVKNLQVLSAACGLVEILSVKQEYKIKLGAAGVVENVITSLQIATAADSTQAVEAIIFCLVSLVGSSKENHAICSQSETLISNLRTVLCNISKRSSKAATGVLWCIALVCRYDRTIESAHIPSLSSMRQHDNIIETLFEVGKIHYRIDSFVESLFWCLFNVVFDENKDILLSFSTSKICDFIVSWIVMYSGNIKIVEPSLGLTSKLCLIPENRAKLTDAKICSSLIHALSTYPNSIEVMTHTFQSLQLLSKDSITQKLINNLGGCELMIKVSSANILEDNTPLTFVAVNCLQELSMDNENNCNRLVESGIFEYLVDVLDIQLRFFSRENIDEKNQTRAAVIKMSMDLINYLLMKSNSLVTMKINRLMNYKDYLMCKIIHGLLNILPQHTEIIYGVSKAIKNLLCIGSTSTDALLSITSVFESESQYYKLFQKDNIINILLAVSINERIEFDEVFYTAVFSAIGSLVLREDTHDVMVSSKSGIDSYMLADLSTTKLNLFCGTLTKCLNNAKDSADFCNIVSATISISQNSNTILDMLADNISTIAVKKIRSDGENNDVILHHVFYLMCFICEHRDDKTSMFAKDTSVCNLIVSKIQRFEQHKSDLQSSLISYFGLRLTYHISIDINGRSTLTSNETCLLFSKYIEYAGETNLNDVLYLLCRVVCRLNVDSDIQVLFAKNGINRSLSKSLQKFKGDHEKAVAWVLKTISSMCGCASVPSILNDSNIQEFRECTIDKCFMEFINKFKHSELVIEALMCALSGLTSNLTFASRLGHQDLLEFVFSILLITTDVESAVLLNTISVIGYVALVESFRDKIVASNIWSRIVDVLQTAINKSKSFKDREYMSTVIYKCCFALNNITKDADANLQDAISNNTTCGTVIKLLENYGDLMNIPLALATVENVLVVLANLTKKNLRTSNIFCIREMCNLLVVILVKGSAHDAITLLSTRLLAYMCGVSCAGETYFYCGLCDFIVEVIAANIDKNIEVLSNLLIISTEISLKCESGQSVLQGTGICDYIALIIHNYIDNPSVIVLCFDYISSLTIEKDTNLKFRDYNICELILSATGRNSSKVISKALFFKSVSAACERLSLNENMCKNFRQTDIHVKVMEILSVPEYQNDPVLIKNFFGFLINIQTYVNKESLLDNFVHISSTVFVRSTQIHISRPDILILTSTLLQSVINLKFYVLKNVEVVIVEEMIHAGLALHITAALSKFATSENIIEKMFELIIQLCCDSTIAREMFSCQHVADALVAIYTSNKLTPSNDDKLCLSMKNHVNICNAISSLCLKNPTNSMNLGTLLMCENFLSSLKHFINEDKVCVSMCNLFYQLGLNHPNILTVGMKKSSDILLKVLLTHKETIEVVGIVSKVITVFARDGAISNDLCDLGACDLLCQVLTIHSSCDGDHIVTMIGAIRQLSIVPKSTSIFSKCHLLDILFALTPLYKDNKIIAIDIIYMIYIQIFNSLDIMKSNENTGVADVISEFWKNKSSVLALLNLLHIYNDSFDIIEILSNIMRLVVTTEVHRNFLSETNFHVTIKKCCLSIQESEVRFVNKDSGVVVSLLNLINTMCFESAKTLAQFNDIGMVDCILHMIRKFNEDLLLMTELVKTVKTFTICIDSSQFSELMSFVNDIWKLKGLYDSAFITEVCSMLSTWCGIKSENRNIISECGVCDILVKNIRVQISVAPLIMVLSACLNHITSECISNCVYLSSNADCSDVLFEVLRLHTSNHSLVANILYVLDNFLSNSKNDGKLFNVIWLQEFSVSVADTHSTDDYVVNACLKLLLNIFLSGNGKFQGGKSLLDKECGVITKSITGFTENRSILISSCKLITSFCPKSPLSIFGNNGACESLVLALEYAFEKNDYAVGNIIIRALISLCAGKHATNQQRLGQTNIFRVIMTYLRKSIEMSFRHSNTTDTMCSIEASLNLISLLARHNTEKVSENIDNIEKLLYEGVCESLLQLLGGYEDDAVLFEATCRCVFSISGGEGCVKRLLAGDVMNLVVQVLLKYENNPNIVFFGCGVIANCILDKQPIQGLIYLNIQTILVSILLNHISSPNVLAQVCATIMNISTYDAVIRSLLGEAGVCDAIIKVLSYDSNIDDMSFCRNALGCLSNLCTSNNSNCEKLLNLQICELSARIIGKFVADEMVCTKWCLLISNMCQSSGQQIVQSFIAVINFGNILESILRNHYESMHVNKCAVNALHLLCVLGGKDVAEFLSNSEVCEQVISGASKHITKTKLVENGLETLVCLVKACERNCQRMIKANIHNLLVDVTQAQKNNGFDSSKICENVCLLVPIAACDVTTKKLLQASVMSSLLLDILDHFMQDVAIVKLCCIAIRTLLNTQEEYNLSIIRSAKEDEDRSKQSFEEHRLRSTSVIFAGLRLYCSNGDVGMELCLTLDDFVIQTTIENSNLTEESCIALATYLQRFASSENYSVAAAHAVCILAQRPQNKTILSKFGICESLCAAMKAFTESEESTKQYVNAIYVLAKGNLDNCRIFGVSGANQCLVQIFVKYSSASLSMNMLSLKCVAILAELPANATILGESGMCEIIGKVIASYKHDVNLYKCAMHCICNLSVIFTNRKLLGCAGILKVINNFVKSNLQNDGIVIATLLALCSMTNASTLIDSNYDANILNEVVLQMEDDGCFQMLNLIFEIYNENPSLMDKVSKLIANIACSDMKMNTKLGENGIVESLIKMLKLNISNASVTIIVCETFQKLFASAGNRFLAGELGFCELLEMMLEIAVDTSNFPLTEVGLLTLDTFITGSCINQERAGQRGIIFLICELVGVGNGVGVDQKGLQCIAHLCRSGRELSMSSEHNAQKFFEKNMGYYVLLALNANIRHKNVVEIGITAIGHMCCYEPLATNIGSLGGCKYICDCAVQFINNESIIDAAVGTIDDLLISDSNLPLLMTGNVCPLLMNILRQYIENRLIVMGVCNCIKKITRLDSLSSSVFGQHGACNAIISCCRRYMDDNVVIIKLMVAIQHISLQNISNKTEFGAVGACDVVTKVLKNYCKTNNLVMSAATFACNALTDKCPENLERLNYAGGVAVLTMATTNVGGGLWTTAKGELE